MKTHNWNIEMALRCNDPTEGLRQLHKYRLRLAENLQEGNLNSEQYEWLNYDIRQAETRLHIRYHYGERVGREETDDE